MENDFRADLHCHSTCSDGSDDPAALLHLAKRASLQGLSITDHDTVDAYTSELFALADELGIKLLRGVEISSELEGIPVHILAYGLKSTDFLLEIQEMRRERNRAILKKLGIPEEEFKGTGRPHIAKLMVEKGYVGSIQEAFHRHLKDGGGFKYSPQEIIDRIHAAKGKAVLAHPHFYKKSSFLKKILSCTFDGIECYYGNLPKAQEMPWLLMAKERGWIATGGSDYHGGSRNIPLGASWVKKEVFNVLSNSD